jgi:hypothetical protein
MEFYSYLKLNNVTQNKQNQLPESTGCEPIQEKNGRGFAHGREK